jgi:hypothetical protein
MLIILANYKWFETAKTNSKVTTYFDSFLVIGSIARGEQNPHATQAQPYKK